MKQRSAFRASAIPVLLAAVLLVLATVGGSVWHSHNGTSDAGCQICHLSHQTATPQLAVSRVTSPVRIGTTPVPADSIRIAGPALPLSISRAPPLA